MTELVILGDPRSIYVRTARMALVEKGVDYRLQPAAPHSDEILAIHPFGRIPAMRHGDVELFEAAAICEYVDGAFDGPPLRPADVVERARMEQWISSFNDYLHPVMIRRYVLQYVFPKGPDGQPDRAVIDEAVPDIAKQFAILDKTYGGRNFLVGDTVTLADLFLAPTLFYISVMPEGESLLAGAPNLKRACAAMAERKSFADTLPPMGQKEAAE